MPLGQEDIQALMAIAHKLSADGQATPASGGSDDGISKLADAVKTAVDGNLQMLEFVKQICERLDKVEETLGVHSATWQGFDSLAKQRDREDGINAMKSKYGAHEEYAPIASAYSEAEGSDIWEPIYETLMQAKDEAEKAEGGDPFDEDGYVGNIFKSTRDYMDKVAGAHGKMAKPVAAEITVAETKPAEETATVESTPDETPDESIDEEKASEMGRMIGERARARREKKSA